MKKVLLLIIGCVQVVSSYAQRGVKPNIIFILTDDQPYAYMGCVGDLVAQTPNLDQLANDGTLFTNYHITSGICTPSRVSMLLGEYERNHGVNFNSGTSVSPEAWQNSYPVALRQNGYYTGYIGKNHSPVGDGGFESGYMEKTFDYWYAGHKHLGFYPKLKHSIFKYAKHDTQVEVLEEGMLDFFTDNGFKLQGALHFLDDRPKTKPFALTICFNLPHDDGTSTMKLLPSDSAIYRTLYRDKNIPLPKNYIAKADIKTPKLPPSILHVSDRQVSYNWVDAPASCKERTIRKMESLTGIDGLIGVLRNRLKELNIDKNTILIFTSDHGQFSGQFGLGGKALNYEVITHVPLIVYNPLLPANLRGKRNDELVQSIDLAPTMLTWAGVKIPVSYQGYDISKLMTGKSKSVREYLFTENLWSTHFGNPRIEAVQNKEWKYIRYYKNNNPSAVQELAVANQLNISETTFLYGVHDNDIALYRSYSDAPFNGEKPVYEELYHLKADPDEVVNVVNEQVNKTTLDVLRNVCDKMVKQAREDGKPMVLRYTNDSIDEMNKNKSVSERKKKLIIKDDN